MLPFSGMELCLVQYWAPDLGVCVFFYLGNTLGLDFEPLRLLRACCMWFHLGVRTLIELGWYGNRPVPSSIEKRHSARMSRHGLSCVAGDLRNTSQYSPSTVSAESGHPSSPSRFQFPSPAFLHIYPSISLPVRPSQLGGR